MKPDDKSETLWFVESGILEIYTMCEGNEFIIDRLYQGSCLNYRSFLQEDLIYVYVRCAKSSNLLFIDVPHLNFIKITHADFEKKFLSYQNAIMRSK